MIIIHPLPKWQLGTSDRNTYVTVSIHCFTLERLTTDVFMTRITDLEEYQMEKNGPKTD